MEQIIVGILVLIMCACSLFQNKERMHAAGFFSLACAAHLIFFDDIEDDYLYYLSDGVLISIALYGLCFHCKTSWFTDNMIYACIASLLLNIYGATSYAIGLGPECYNYAFYSLYAYVIFLMLKKETMNEGDSLDWLRLPYRKCAGCYFLLRQEKD